MILEQVYLIAEIIAAFAMVGSVLYLGIQMKQNRAQIRNEAMDIVANKRSSLLLMLAESSELSYIVAKGIGSWEKLTPNEKFRYNFYLYSLFLGFETGFVKWNNKDINDDVWISWEETITYWISFPSVQGFWQINGKIGFTKDFRDYLQDIIIKVKEVPTENLKKQLAFMESAGHKKARVNI